MLLSFFLQFAKQFLNLRIHSRRLPSSYIVPYNNKLSNFRAKEKAHPFCTRDGFFLLLAGLVVLLGLARLYYHCIINCNGHGLDDFAGPENNE